MTSCADKLKSYENHYHPLYLLYRSILAILNLALKQSSPSSLSFKFETHVWIFEFSDTQGKQLYRIAAIHKL